MSGQARWVGRRGKRFLVRGREPFLGAAVVLLEESGCTIRKWRSGTTGRAAVNSDEWEIEVPEPRGPVSFATFAHEVGHQRLHRGNARPRWQEEVEAWEYALEQFDRFDLPGKDAAEPDAAKHLAWNFVKAVRRSRPVAAKIIAAYPEWWARAEAYEAESMLNPSKSSERRALDEARS